MAKINVKGSHLYSDLDSLSLSLSPLYFASFSLGKKICWWLLLPIFSPERCGVGWRGWCSILHRFSHSKGIHLPFSLNSFPLTFHLTCYLTFSLPPIWFKQWSRTISHFLKNMNILLPWLLDFLKWFTLHKTFLLHSLGVLNNTWKPPHLFLPTPCARNKNQSLMVFCYPFIKHFTRKDNLMQEKGCVRYFFFDANM